MKEPSPRRGTNAFVGYCPCGSKRMNQRSQVDSAVLFAVVDCGRKGVGVLALEKLKANTFIGEYVGEVVGGAELQRRRQVINEFGDSSVLSR
ncbi:hypothetical protein PPTG_08258 [Phytophthora nicotianae INRA-310]|uniref:SET domain-containing protein n=1 Tax=Phytophthora nicotianae (strain INRA-310) TaxID=761204 RepID=W2QJV4_PHYN3|nr:hypothetical protein PPTG_08258 [Phytophthora nicotianae INRA-310]ETN13423.1 hypothetical protein PPTG_08258 [Phytophthora nicotianae INRA-310]